MSALDVRLAQRGLLTLPGSWRRKYGLKPGVRLTLLDLGGVFVVSPRGGETDALADRLARSLARRGLSLEQMLRDLRAARDKKAAAAGS